MNDHILENLDAILQEEALGLFHANKGSWDNMKDFIKDFEEAYLNQRCFKIIKNNLKFCNQKKGQHFEHL